MFRVVDPTMEGLLGNFTLHRTHRQNFVILPDIGETYTGPFDTTRAVARCGRENAQAPETHLGHRRVAAAPAVRQCGTWKIQQGVCTAPRVQHSCLGGQGARDNEVVPTKSKGCRTEQAQGRCQRRGASAQGVFGGRDLKGHLLLAFAHRRPVAFPRKGREDAGCPRGPNAAGEPQRERPSEVFAACSVLQQRCERFPFAPSASRSG